MEVTVQLQMSTDHVHLMQWQIIVGDGEVKPLKDALNAVIDQFRSMYKE